ncbi:carboxypeptidase-like regulatory domain-containing protein [Rufibacter roseus]|uniref:Carboxypeptidase-like regulatory domain-containing protein n=1 Tax=Rufibacter roseus TaxID=1567108 RepID=A0ABW2DU40_9BACT|nr:carboxypeptidase-like regulatory domain-containing protein [Rufibacter roseus]
MQRIYKLIFKILFILCIVSCSQDDDDIGIETVISGHVSDLIRGEGISGYKVVLEKMCKPCGSGKTSTQIEEIATAITDANGNYSITFNYKLEDRESYIISSKFNGVDFFTENYPTWDLKPGTTNMKNFSGWRPVRLRLTLNVLNNVNKPLMVRNEFTRSNPSSNWGINSIGVQNIYEENITQTYILKSRPNDNTKLIFWYYTGPQPNRTLHQKTFSYPTSLDDMTDLSFTIDCSTF